MEWTDAITVDRPDTQVFLAISDLHEVGHWWAPVAASGGTCSIQGDGTSSGSALILRDGRGIEQGRLQLVSARLDRVEFRQLSHGPGRRAVDAGLAYRLQDVGASATIVMCDVHVQTRLPAGLRRLAESRLDRHLRAARIRELRQLKAHVEAQPVWR